MLFNLLKQDFPRGQSQNLARGGFTTCMYYFERENVSEGRIINETEICREKDLLGHISCLGKICEFMKHFMRLVKDRWDELQTAKQNLQG